MMNIIIVKILDIVSYLLIALKNCFNIFGMFIYILGKDDHARALQDVSDYLQHNCSTMTVRNIFGYYCTHINYNNTAQDISRSA